MDCEFFSTGEPALYIRIPTSVPSALPSMASAKSANGPPCRAGRRDMSTCDFRKAIRWTLPVF